MFRVLVHHPGRYVRQSAIALLDDKDLGALKAMMPHKKGHLTKARMKPIVDFFSRRSDTRQYVAASSGLGKSWLACALGHKACRENMSVLYTRMPRLFADLAIAHGDARYGRLLRSIARVKLLILDDWGPESLTPDQARDLLEIVEDRYDKGSLVITSQVPVDRWHDMIGVPTLADAILDRIVHNAYRVELAGESLRKRQTSPKSKHS